MSVGTHWTYCITSWSYHGYPSTASDNFYLTLQICESWKQVKIDARGGGAGRAKKPSGSFCPTGEVNWPQRLCSYLLNSETLGGFPFVFRSSNAPWITCENDFDCVQGICLSDFIRSIEVGGHFRTRCLGKRTSRPWSLKSLSHIESRTVHCLTWRILTQGELVGSRVSSSVAESVFFFPGVGGCWLFGLVAYYLRSPLIRKITTFGFAMIFQNAHQPWSPDKSSNHLQVWRKTCFSLGRSDRVWIQGQNTTTRSWVAIYLWCSCDLVKVDNTRIDHLRGKSGMKWLCCLALWFLQMWFLNCPLHHCTYNLQCNGKSVLCWSFLNMFYVFCICDSR